MIVIPCWWDGSLPRYITMGLEGGGEEGRRGGGEEGRRKEILITFQFDLHHLLPMPRLVGETSSKYYYCSSNLFESNSLLFQTYVIFVVLCCVVLCCVVLCCVVLCCVVLCCVVLCCVALRCVALRYVIVIILSLR